MEKKLSLRSFDVLVITGCDQGHRLLYSFILFHKRRKVSELIYYDRQGIRNWILNQFFTFSILRIIEKKQNNRTNKNNQTNKTNNY